MQYEELKRKINREYGGVKKAAKNMGMSAKTLDLKLNGRILFDAFEVCELCRLLGISRTEEKLYFFYPPRPKNGTKEKKGGKAACFLNKNGKREKYSKQEKRQFKA